MFPAYAGVIPHFAMSIVKLKGIPSVCGMIFSGTYIMYKKVTTI